MAKRDLPKIERLICNYIVNHKIPVFDDERVYEGEFECSHVFSLSDVLEGTSIDPSKLTMSDLEDLHKRFCKHYNLADLNAPDDDDFDWDDFDWDDEEDEAFDCDDDDDQEVSDDESDEDNEDFDWDDEEDEAFDCDDDDDDQEVKDDSETWFDRFNSAIPVALDAVDDHIDIVSIYQIFSYDGSKRKERYGLISTIGFDLYDDDIVVQIWVGEGTGRHTYCFDRYDSFNAKPFPLVKRAANKRSIREMEAMICNYVVDNNIRLATRDEWGRCVCSLDISEIIQEKYDFNKLTCLDVFALMHRFYNQSVPKYIQKKIDWVDWDDWEPYRVFNYQGLKIDDYYDEMLMIYFKFQGSTIDMDVWDGFPK